MVKVGVLGYFPPRTVACSWVRMLGYVIRLGGLGG